jgi:hypothetical protein
MSRRLILAVVALWLLPLSSSAQEAKRDWKKCPAVVDVDTEHDLYAIGDVHGDYDRLTTLLVAAKLIAEEPSKPEMVKWNAGKAVLVCTGDMIDKGDQGVRVLQLFRALRADAEKTGGRVIVLAGNHEAEFLANPSIEKSAEFRKELKARNIKPDDVAAGKDALGLGEFLRSLPFAARVNDWFFSHAGNTHGRTLAKLRDDLERGVEGKGYKADVLQDPNSLLLARMNPRPWWERAKDEGDAGQKRLAGYAKALGVRHIILGHAPAEVTFADKSVRKAGEMYQKFDGLVFMIDVGMSRAVGYSTGAILLIQRGKHATASAIYADGKRKQMWGSE